MAGSEGTVVILSGAALGCLLRAVLPLCCLGMSCVAVPVSPSWTVIPPPPTSALSEVLYLAFEASAPAACGACDRHWDP